MTLQNAESQTSVKLERTMAPHTLNERTSSVRPAGISNNLFRIHYTVLVCFVEGSVVGRMRTLVVWHNWHSWHALMNCFMSLTIIGHQNREIMPACDLKSRVAAWTPSLDWAKFRLKPISAKLTTRPGASGSRKGNFKRGSFP